MVINKYNFIRLLSKRAGFTLADTRILWKTVEEIFEEAIETETILALPGFGRLYYIPLKAHRGYDPLKGEYCEFPEAKKVLFSLSKRFRDLLREPTKRKVDKAENRELRKLMQELSEQEELEEAEAEEAEEQEDE